MLDEVSIISPRELPAYRGAKVVRITERGTALSRMRERQEREQAQAKPKPPPATARTEPVGEVFYGGGPYSGSVVKRSNPKAVAEEAELRRRIEWTERHRGRVDFEQILTNMKIELGYETDLARRVLRV